MGRLPTSPGPLRAAISAVIVIWALVIPGAVQAQDKGPQGDTQQDDTLPSDKLPSDELPSGTLHDEPAGTNPELGLVGDEPAPDDAPEVTGSADDHQSVVGTFGVGFFGIERLPILLPGFDPNQCVDTACEGPTVAAPTVGIRYWLSDRLALQAALGFHLSSGTISTEAGDQDTLSTFGLAVHLAAPLAVASSGHFVFQVVPFVNTGFARGSVVDPQSPDSDQDLSGFLFEVGGTVGAEIHFGFIDLPALALQANVGLSMRWENRGVVIGDAETDHSTTRVTTLEGDDPWELLTGALSAIYYLP